MTMTTPASTTPPSLFRADALVQARTRAHGSVLLARPLSYAVLTTLFVIIAATIVAFLCVGSYTRKVAVQGVLTPTHGVLKLVAAQSGLVVESRVKEGQVVAAGEVLFVLNSGRETPGQGNAEETIAQLLVSRRESLRRDQVQQRQQDAQRLHAARHRAEDIASEIQRMNDQVALQQRRVEMSKTTLTRYTDLAASNFVSPVQVQEKQADLLDQEQRLAELQRAASAGLRDLNTAQADIRDQEVQSARDQQASDRAMSATSQDIAENEARRLLYLRAPSAGTVTAIVAEQGQSVTANQSLAVLIPAGSQLEAELYAPSRAVGFIRSGMTVQLRYQSYAFQKFGQANGHVRDISSTALRPSDLSLPGATIGDEPVYRIRVSLDRQSVPTYGVNQPLRAGTTLDGSILLDKRRLYEWVLEPLYTITGHL